MMTQFHEENFFLFGEDVTNPQVNSNPKRKWLLDASSPPPPLIDRNPSWGDSNFPNTRILTYHAISSISKNH
ncbi:hypothetical protein C0J52_16270 [Blattella germanica]|nr:hypothetical protein C0J52_16270 [Blattella germanica]